MRKKFVPRLEAFEDRLVPANFYWRPPVVSDSMFNTPANWQVNGETATTAPGPIDKIIFLSTNQNDWICNLTANATVSEVSFISGGYLAINGFNFTTGSLAFSAAGGLTSAISINGGMFTINDSTKTSYWDRTDAKIYALGNDTGGLYINGGVNFLIGNPLNTVNGNFTCEANVHVVQGSISFWNINGSFNEKGGVIDIPTVNGEIYISNDGVGNNVLTEIDPQTPTQQILYNYGLIDMQRGSAIIHYNVENAAATAELVVEPDSLLDCDDISQLDGLIDVQAYAQLTANTITQSNGTTQISGTSIQGTSSIFVWSQYHQFGGNFLVGLDVSGTYRTTGYFNFDGGGIYLGATNTSPARFFNWVNTSVGELGAIVFGFESTLYMHFSAYGADNITSSNIYQGGTFRLQMMGYVNQGTSYTMLNGNLNDSQWDSTYLGWSGNTPLSQVFAFTYTTNSLIVTKYVLWP